MQGLELMQLAVKCADSKKAMDIKVLDIGSLTTLADYFVVCHCPSSTQMNAISDEIEEKFKEQGLLMLNQGAHGSDQWILMDYGDVVVHIFNTESREFYGIEKLWADAANVDISGIVTE